ncbi:Gfo/Idh/MocA family protein [Agromyces ramosus]|uniref:Dehydrogenase n=1 Tax=Agromyces ramosus TaxID=33879 RepID=A0ABU0RC18_9MICO|nr:Gfo/Idh/MocA family oxidoreductase [Agromyces ramosus]MDQ0894791.1 putative dehydrogenase [Agromyces ramosus]
MSAATPPRIGIAGVRGHGASHVHAALELEREGRARLAALADRRSPRSEHDGVATYTGAYDMIAEAQLDIVVLSTPMHTHLPLALAALEAGAHVLLEKPPTPTLDEFHRLLAAADAAGRAVQLGFQSLGSAAVPAMRELIADGVIGDPVRFGALGTWIRSVDYWRRTPWAGRRTLDGVPVVDGAVTNPLAHAVATALAVAGATGESDVANVRLDLYRANDIEADDTSSLVIDLARGGQLACALSLTAVRPSEPCVIVEGTAGRLVLWYTLDVVQLVVPGASIPTTTTYPREGLLANLVDHVADGAPLLVPAAATGAFMRVLEAVRTGPAPTRIDDRFVTRLHDAEGEHLVVDDLQAWSERVIAEGRTFAELGAHWATGG